MIAFGADLGLLGVELLVLDNERSAAINAHAPAMKPRYTAVIEVSESMVSRKTKIEHAAK